MYYAVDQQALLNFSTCWHQAGVPLRTKVRVGCLVSEDVVNHCSRLKLRSSIASQQQLQKQLLHLIYI